RARRPRLSGRAPRGRPARRRAHPGGPPGPAVRGTRPAARLAAQWHGDTFDLPPGAVRLASSPLAPNQAFRAGERAYGVQFHLEVTGEMANEWSTIPAYRDSLAETLGDRDGAAFIAAVDRRADELHPPARRLFANWLELAGASR
ncbi:MAG: type 1 glutamine amidotransferase, partial [Thermoleophilaceae bacterium]